MGSTVVAHQHSAVRVAASDGDVRQWVRATHMSSWLIYVVVGYPVLWAMIDRYRTVLPDSLDTSRSESPVGRAAVLVVATVVMFTYFAFAGLLEDGLLSVFVARTSLLLIPVIIFVNWRRIVTRQGSRGRRSLLVQDGSDDQQRDQEDHAEG